MCVFRLEVHWPRDIHICMVTCYWGNIIHMNVSICLRAMLMMLCWRSLNRKSIPSFRRNRANAMRETEGIYVATKKKFKMKKEITAEALVLSHSAKIEQIPWQIYNGTTTLSILGEVFLSCNFQSKRHIYIGVYSIRLRADKRYSHACACTNMHMCTVW